MIPALSFALSAVGLAGLPDDLKTWAEWLDMIDHTLFWYGLAGIAFALTVGMVFRDLWLARVSYFDVPILDAINHLVQTTPHSYQRSGQAELHFFRVLHRQMCSGALPVVGMQGEEGLPKRISRRQCKRLMPQEVVIPPNPTSPYGRRFSLIDSNIPSERYLGLRVRSRDLYRMWPKNQAFRTQGVG